jgi:hypothetical protein
MIILSIMVPGEICQVTDMASFLYADQARKELMTCLSYVGIKLK